MPRGLVALRAGIGKKCFFFCEFPQGPMSIFEECEMFFSSRLGGHFVVRPNYRENTVGLSVDINLTGFSVLSEEKN